MKAEWLRLSEGMARLPQSGAILGIGQMSEAQHGSAHDRHEEDVVCRPHPGISLAVRVVLDQQRHVRRVRCDRLVEGRLCSAMGNQCLYHAGHGLGQFPLTDGHGEVGVVS